MPRLFLGVKPPVRVWNDVHENVHVKMQTHGKGLRVSPPANWHVTVHFIGDVTPRAARKITETFRRAKLPKLETSSPVQLGGKQPIQTFGKDVIFLDVNDAGKTLHALHEWSKKLIPVTLTHATYRPHFTLARNPKGHSLTSLLNELNAKPFTSTFQPSELILFDSLQEKSKTVYHSLAKKRIPYRKIVENP